MKLDKMMAAIVTGGASGLGEATARMLASHGVKVAILDMNAERGEAVARDIGAFFCRTDVTDEASIDAGLAQARAANGIERILVNCAGIAPGRRTVTKKRETGELIGHDIASFRRAIEINLIGTYAMITKCSVAMATLDPVTPDGERGVIVNTSSIAAQDGQIGQAAYASSKGGVLSLTLPVARDLSGFGIRVMSIMPGLFQTPLLEGIAEEYTKALEANIPFPSRLGRPEEYAALVKVILESEMLNGEGIRIDGALRMQPK